MSSISDSARLASIETTLTSMSKQIGVLFKSIEGNGTPGLKQRLTAIEVSHKNCQEDRRDEANRKPANTNNWINTFMLFVTIISIWLTK